MAHAYRGRRVSRNPGGLQIKMKAGKNIAIKVPSDAWQATVSFYRDVVRLAEVEVSHANSRAFAFGSMSLWIDKCPHLSQSEVWLELCADSIEAASQELNIPGIVRRDDIEELPPDMRAFWIKAPSGIIHLVSEIQNEFNIDHGETTIAPNLK